MRTVLLVGCADTKAKTAQPARTLYRSGLFRDALHYAEKRQGGRDVFILSAKHGAIEPSAVIEPYDLEIKTLPDEQRLEWARSVIAGFRARWPGEELLLVVLAGKAYADALARARRGVRPLVAVESPLDGMGLGPRRKFFRQDLAERGIEWRIRPALPQPTQRAAARQPKPRKPRLSKGDLVRQNAARLDALAAAGLCIWCKRNPRAEGRSTCLDCKPTKRRG